MASNMARGSWHPSQEPVYFPDQLRPVDFSGTLLLLQPTAIELKIWT
jgi:hypothetical protein